MTIADKAGPSERSLLDERISMLCEGAAYLGQIATSQECTTPTEDYELLNAQVLFITGPHASGKSAVANLALSDEGYLFFDTGPILRGYHRSEVGEGSFGDWVMRNEEQYGRDFTDELLARHIGHILCARMTGSPAGVAIIGHRSLHGVEYIRERLGIRNSQIVYIDASPEVLFERYKAREGKQDLSRDQFTAILEADLRLGLQSLADQADGHISNTGEISVAVSELREFVR